MNERRLADVRFGAHNGLGSDIASCTLCAMNGHRALSVQRRNDCSVRKEKRSKVAHSCRSSNHRLKERLPCET